MEKLLDLLCRGSVVTVLGVLTMIVGAFLKNPEVEFAGLLSIFIGLVWMTFTGGR